MSKKIQENDELNSKLEKIKFSQTAPKCDRIYYVNAEDIKIVLGRIPYGFWSRLRAVYFNDKGQGVRALGYTTQGRRDIALCALPPRVSLTRFLAKGQAPQQLGAQLGAQWPTLAIRRYLLYDVLLHELGHLQMVDEKAKSVRRKFAGENLAQDFADYWRATLWQEPFSHDDPVHNKPTENELK